jgi:Tfp pilus assembly protein PilF
MKKNADKERSTEETAQEHLELGKFYFLNQRFDEAIEQLKKAVSFDDKNPDIYFSLGVVYEAINQVSEAKESFLRALEIRPDMKSAQEHLDKLIGV